MDRWTLAKKIRGTPQEREEALVSLWERFYPPGLSFLRTAFSSLRGSEEDILQDAFLALITKADTYNPLFAPSTWFYTVLRRKALDALDRKARGSDLEFDPPSPSWSEPEYQWEQNFLGEHLERFLQSRPEPVRSLFWLRYREGLDLGAISKITGRKVGTLKSDFFQLRRELRFWYTQTIDQEVPHGRV